MNKLCRTIGMSVSVIGLMIGVASKSQLLFSQCRQLTNDMGGHPEAVDYSNEEAKQCALPPTPTEAYVLREVQAGRSVRFEKNSQERKLGGCFIKRLLTNAKLKVPLHGLMIENAVIVGPVDVRNAEVSFQVALTWCTFLDDFNIMRAHFTKGLSLAGSSFGFGSCPGKLDAEFAKIEPDFALNDCTFHNSDSFFNGISISQDWIIRRANFAKADFTGATIGGDLYANKEQPTDPPTQFHRDADFEFVKVKQEAVLTDITFDGFVSFGGAEFKNLAIEGSTFNGNVNFKGTKIDNFYFGKPTINQTLTIEDTTFQYMAPEDWDALESYAIKSNMDTNAKTYNAQLYTNLEALFQRHGHSDDADAIYIAGKERERNEMHIVGPSGKKMNLLWKPWSFIKDKLVGYGRHQEYLLWWVLVFLAIGNWVFHREAGMKTKKREDARLYYGRYSGFWYTLDLFLPIIGLGEAELWTPKDNRRWARFYKRIHIIAGALIIPIGLAAWTGIIK
jgi:uncharacterized protein YjbI with pentapeptide repeats